MLCIWLGGRKSEAKYMKPHKNDLALSLEVAFMLLNTNNMYIYECRMEREFFEKQSPPNILYVHIKYEFYSFSPKEVRAPSTDSWLRHCIWARSLLHLIFVLNVHVHVRRRIGYKLIIINFRCRCCHRFEMQYVYYFVCTYIPSVWPSKCAATSENIFIYVHLHIMKLELSYKLMIIIEIDWRSYDFSHFFVESFYCYCYEILSKRLSLRKWNFARDFDTIDCRHRKTTFVKHGPFPRTKQKKPEQNVIWKFNSRIQFVVWSLAKKSLAWRTTSAVS